MIANLIFSPLRLYRNLLSLYSLIFRRNKPMATRIIRIFANTLSKVASIIKFDQPLIVFRNGSLYVMSVGIFLICVGTSRYLKERILAFLLRQF